ncbi:MAG: PTS sugar transporter subunit IIA [Candidatus Lambdaproteobacteria bacterium]|nr:PTS sugar transporter subunit IIA [Candidatus Lambdaproteobacteria bacterium]
MPIKLLEYLSPPTIDLQMEASSKEEVLSRLVDVLVRNALLPAENRLLDALLEREGLGSTGIGHGVAIPHGRTAEIAHPTVVLGRTLKPIDFDAIDGQPTRLFFLLVAPENGGDDHLFLLARIARLMKDAHTRDRLMTVETPDDVLALLREQDRR